MGNPRRLAERLVHLFVLLAEVFLGFRLVFRLLNADTTNSFVRWVYSMTETLLEPFSGWFPAELFDNTYVLEYRTLFAMAAFAVIGYAALAFIHWLPKPKLEQINWNKLGQR